MNKADIVDNPIWLFLEGEIKKEVQDSLAEFPSMSLDLVKVANLQGRLQGKREIIDMVESWKEKTSTNERQNLT